MNDQVWISDQLIGIQRAWEGRNQDAPESAQAQMLLGQMQPLISRLLEIQYTPWLEDAGRIDPYFPGDDS